MHHFKGSGESHVREPHTGDRNVPTRGTASVAGLSGSPERKASVGPTGLPLVLAVQGAPCGYLPELLQEETTYSDFSSIKDIYSIMCYEECTQ